MTNRIAIFVFLFLPFFCEAQNINTIAGTGVAGFSGDTGPALAAKIWSPASITIDHWGNIYITDAGNKRIRKINTSGIITTMAGLGASGYNGDNIPATSAILDPGGIDCDSFGNIYIADFGNNRIRKINTSGIITTIAGTGSSGYSGDNALATSAQIHDPCDVAVDDSGNIFIADRFNQAIRKIDKNGVINTFAGGNGFGYFGDGGPATLAKFFNPASVDLDDSGNVYIGDYDNHCIRKINAAGIISTFAGTGTQANTGDGGLATAADLGGPEGVAIDKIGNVFIADAWYSVIRRVNTFGIINTIAGTGTAGFFGDGGPAVLAQLNTPAGIVLDTIGNLYLCDASNNRVRKIDTIGVMGVYTPKVNKIEFVVWPSPASDNLTLYSNTELGSIKIYDALGQLVLEAKTKAKEEYIDVSTLQNGIYFVQVKTNQGTITKKTVIQH